MTTKAARREVLPPSGRGLDEAFETLLAIRRVLPLALVDPRYLEAAPPLRHFRRAQAHR